MSPAVPSTSPAPRWQTTPGVFAEDAKGRIWWLSPTGWKRAAWFGWPERDFTTLAALHGPITLLAEPPPGRS